jgi:hypothetical protein
MIKHQHLNLIVNGKFPCNNPFCSSRYFFSSSTDEMPQSWMKIDDKYVSRYAPKVANKSEINSNESDITITSDNTNIDRIADQVKKHAAINYCYYTRTK